MIFNQKYHGRKGALQRCRLWVQTLGRDMQKSGVYRSVTEYVPMITGAILTLLLFWSFFVSPLLEAAQEHVIQHEDKSKATEAGRHTLSVDGSSRQNYGGGHGAEDFMPERTDIESLLNKTLSIDPLLNTSFTLGARISDWDEQRRAFLEKNPDANVDSSGRPKLFMLTGSQPGPCHNLMGDHMLLKAVKNKIDYCRIHDMELFYNMATFSRDMPSWWVKLPLIRSFMLAHPEVEWLWWIDSDAVLTDMTFQFPSERYKDYNLVIHGWEHLVYGERKWTGLNMGIFLVRNCQWTLDLFDTLAPMGYRGVVGDRVGKVLTMALSGRPESFESDDQGAFIYLLNADRNTWGSKVYLENSYFLNGYWKDIVDKYEGYVESSHPGFGDDRWPFVTHFTGCQICSGKINNVYTAEECTAQMSRALTLADNQVLHSYGYAHPSLATAEIVPVDKKDAGDDHH
ncbi:glycosyltransferase CAZy family GT34-like protein [Selaginella moellendorffii]|uniref:Glycosyltransferase CAZy family GT34-like protein n=1 Tax=Selaginella moellendorffii TaxID=88036 RepID=D8T3P8_SELML|nr:xyloglucan 6-xylosyltransferase 2 [Selaginella moellendorffii]XP_002992472.1 xyloglucan 6-xylosyltransferase 2 [Selaginella moellendorffii]EFJ06410.1 glycosyltransferase CAZy family GT34-like protein [Selaginella moellendorffii]EFJ08776.1 glycosyltransferase CAZy family GT34-like protein [Selaginella moellendorffii]|eukprot:XP_002990216.1 xyloglucan 6-xylosyltransferase 2 [Selaginella moellendorffii]